LAGALLPWRWGSWALIRIYRRAEAARANGGLDAADRARRDQLEARWLFPVLKRIGARPGARALIDALRARGVPQIVLSDYPALGKLAALELTGFAQVYAAESLGLAKPAPELLERVSADHGIPLERIVHIGDRADTDAALARKTGAGFIDAHSDLQALAAAISSSNPVR
jgi:FMN phosphatase YigB (HAD superfamily)